MGGLPCQFGAFLPEVSLFDAALFSVSGPEASLMDPQQRFLLECGAEVLMGAGKLALQQQPGLGAKCAVGTFVGISSMDYNKVGWLLWYLAHLDL